MLHRCVVEDYCRRRADKECKHQSSRAELSRAAYVLLSRIDKIRDREGPLTHFPSSFDFTALSRITRAFSYHYKMADFSPEWQKKFLIDILRRPEGLTEVRRDGKDNAAIARVIKAEFDRRIKLGPRNKERFTRRMEEFAHACWLTMESMHLLFLDDDQPENEKARLDPDHWYENNLANASLFANLTLDGLPQLVPGRLFSTRMPRDIVNDLSERRDFLHKVKVNKLRAICVLTEEHEFEKYSGDSKLLEFYRNECKLTVYNRAIPDFQIPTSGDLVNNILDLVYHLAKGENSLVHCAGGSGRTGMVIAAIIKNLGVYDPISRVRKVKSTYVETYDQELFLRNLPKVIDKRIVNDCPTLAKAIAAEHLIQVFYTHGTTDDKKIDKSQDIVEQLEEEEGSALEAKLKEAYLQTFDLVDTDKSGTLDKEELMDWLRMCGSELDLSTLTGELLKHGTLSRERFAQLMCTSASSSRRDYDIGGSIGKSQH